jgi:hypothetical protein
MWVVMAYFRKTDTFAEEAIMDTAGEESMVAEL